MDRRALVLLLAIPTAAHAEDDDLARARFLDQQGVHAFADGRYRDAMALFHESYRAGGPPTELWNIARCQLKLEDADGAHHTLETYLAQHLSADDRSEARRLLDEIEHRASTFVVATTPQGAFVQVDGHVLGMTPYAGSLAAGAHDVKLWREGGAGVVRHVDARDGRPIVLSVELTSDHPPVEPPAKHAASRFTAELGAVGMVSVLGGGTVVEGGAAPEVSMGYALLARDLRLGVGLRLRASFDTWTTGASTSNAAFGCVPPVDYSGVEVLATPTVFGSFQLSPRIAVGARVGIGAAIYASGSPIGGDLFTPACAYGGSLTVDGYAALDVSLLLVSPVKLVLFPATVDVHPGYVGVRSDANVDASGAWWRVGLGVALAVEL